MGGEKHGLSDGIRGEAGVSGRLSVFVQRYQLHHAGALVERVSGEPLEVYAARNVFQPLGMMHTRYLPPKAWKARLRRPSTTTPM